MPFILQSKNFSYTDGYVDIYVIIFFTTLCQQQNNNEMFRLPKFIYKAFLPRDKYQ